MVERLQVVVQPLVGSLVEVSEGLVVVDEAQAQAAVSHQRIFDSVCLKGTKDSAQLAFALQQYHVVHPEILTKIEISETANFSISS